MKPNKLLQHSCVVEALESRRLLAAAPWGFFPHLIGQDLAVQNYPQLTGQGETVAVIDSGAEYKTPALGGGVGPGFKIFTGWNFVNNDANLLSQNIGDLHATGVIGVLAANPYVYNNRFYQGIAPNVGVILLKEDSSQHVKDAMQWVIAHRVQYNIVAVNLTDFYQPGEFNASVYSVQAAQLKAAGVFIASPGGNLGATVPVAVSSPAADPSIFGVTGIDHTGAIASYFQRDANIDALAPGKGVTLPWYDWTKQTNIFTDYGEGSSWSSPHVTGTAVLLKQIDPNFTPDEIMSIIRASGVPTFDPISGMTFPRLNVYNAIKLAYAVLAGTAQSTPFFGSPLSTYGTTIQAENYDKGGAGIGYSDPSPSGLGVFYRPDGVDFEPATDTGGGYNIGWIHPGEWLNYTVNVPATGTYGIDVRVASLGAGGTFHFEVNGVNVTGEMTIPDTGGWQTWTTISAANVSLTGGVHTLRMVFDTAGAGGFAGNVNWFQVTGGPAPTETAFPGPNPSSIPGQISIVNFDTGGPGVAYNDLTLANQGSQYRTADSVDIEKSSDTAGGYDVGWNQPGEWLQYTVNVAAAGTYTLSIRDAYGGPNATGGTVHLESDGVDVSGPITLAKTGGWQTWQTVTMPGVTLSAGTHVLRLAMDKDGAGSTASNAYLANLNWFSLTPVIAAAAR